MAPTIPFNRPWLCGRELHYIAEAIQSGHSSGNGAFTHRCQKLLQQLLGVERALLTTSCTDALEMAALLLDLGPGDEVIVPSYTFVSTANAFALRGTQIVFSDVRPDTLNLDEAKLESLITERTRAIVVVHYASVGCEMDAIMEIARRYHVPVIEDNAHGLFARYRGRPLGSFGALATLSFHETKNISCGEGGALLVNDPALIERAEILWEKGTNRAKFFRGEVDKYSWVDLGSSFLPSDVVAAFLLAQLEERDEIQRRRRRIWENYRDQLSEWANAHGVRLPFLPDSCEPSWHMFYLVLQSRVHRDGLIRHLRERDILSVFHYVPLHTSPMGKRLSATGDCPVTEEISERLVRLPFYNNMTEPEQECVVSAVLDYDPGR
jgi:dTDP-4-amino-4,6-dideoxygalactose transaminase